MIVLKKIISIIIICIFLLGLYSCKYEEVNKNKINEDILFLSKILKKYDYKKIEKKYSDKTEADIQWFDENDDEIKINKLYEKIDKLSNSIPIEWKNYNSYIKYFLIDDSENGVKIIKYYTDIFNVLKYKRDVKHSLDNMLIYKDKNNEKYLYFVGHKENIIIYGYCDKKNQSHFLRVLNEMGFKIN